MTVQALIAMHNPMFSSVNKGGVTFRVSVKCDVTFRVTVKSNSGQKSITYVDCIWMRCNDPEFNSQHSDHNMFLLL